MRCAMIGAVVGSFAALLMASPASAQSHAWSGFYVGGSIGLRATDLDWRTTSIFPTLPAPFTPLGPDGTAGRDFGETDFRFAGYAGFNAQVAPTWVLGIEASIGTSIDSSNPKVGIPGAPAAVPGYLADTSNDRVSIATDWDANVRARIGYLVTPATMLYLAGGVAFQDVVFRASCVGNPITNACFQNNTESQRKLRTGWTIGGGVEQSLGGKLFARIDYAYSDFGTFSHTFFRGAADVTVPFDDQFGGKVDLSTHAVNFGLAYKF